MPLSKSSASDDEAFRYRNGGCHVFAVALHRIFGWHIYLVLDQEERFWEDPEDDDNWLPSVVHAYALDGDGNAWDVLGSRPVSEILEETVSWATIGSYDSDCLRSEDELGTYVGSWADEGEDPVDRPLAKYDESEISEAIETIRRALSDVPGFPSWEPRP